ncbi:MAG: anaerobic ribonucleoside-triphosphate reductase activating protein [Clostridia bacterium]|nr:anaerobic ribonucleoside-triphosphate reductase activating protein [Clostridia bacterium]
MKICGIQKLTLLDFPGRIACTVFLGGCNFRCPYCHNGSLVRPGEFEEIMTVEKFLDFLDTRVGRLQGVCISGGEPTLHSDLPELVGEIKSRGFEVKLDTNGTNPEMLYRLINDGLVDYVAMDIKNSIENYPETTGLKEGYKAQSAELLIEGVKQSAELLMQGRVDFEFRTTLMRELHSVESIESIGRWLRGDEKFFLQTYRDEGDLLVGGFSPFTRAETESLIMILKKYIPNAEIR